MHGYDHSILYYFICSAIIVICLAIIIIPALWVTLVSALFLNFLAVFVFFGAIIYPLMAVEYLLDPLQTKLKSVMVVKMKYPLDECKPVETCHFNAENLKYLADNWFRENKLPLNYKCEADNPRIMNRCSEVVQEFYRGMYSNNLDDKTFLDMKKYGYQAYNNAIIKFNKELDEQ